MEDIADALRNKLLQGRVCLTQQLFSGFPIDAGIRNRLTVDELIERLREFLVSSHEIAFKHRPDDGFLTGGTLAHDLTEDIRHATVVLGAVAVAGVDHDRGV